MKTVSFLLMGLIPATMFIDIKLSAQPGTPCPGIPTVTYEGQVYNTVQIGEQCWLKENLNVGEMMWTCT